MPQPAGRPSSWRAGNGLTISKRRNRARAMRASRQLTRLPSRAIHWPATSSMTTKPGSWRPLSRAAIVAAGTPRAMESAMPERRVSSSVWGEGWAKRAYAAQSRTAATEPQVPGPGLPKPAPKKVATAQAHHFVGFLFWTGVVDGEGSFAIGALVAAAGESAEVFEDFGIEDWRTDFVDAHGPLAQIDLAATVGAEGKVFVFEPDESAAGGAAQEP